MPWLAWALSRQSERGADRHPGVRRSAGIGEGDDADQDDVTVDKVAATGQNDDALSLSAVRQQVLDSLVIGGDADGIEITGDDGVIRGTWVRGVGEDCFEVTGANARLTDNHARRCENIGFDIVGAEPKVGGADPRAEGNTSDATKLDGFDVVCTGACNLGFVRGNSASNVSTDQEGFVIVVGVGLGSPFVVSGNRAFKNTGEGFGLNTNGALITDNIAERNGTTALDEAIGIEVNGDNNILRRNVARFNKRDGFQIDGDGNY